MLKHSTMNKNFTKGLFSLFLIMLASLAFGQSTIVWNGAGATNNFSEAANWTGSVVPTTGDDVVFDGTSSKNCDLDMDIDIQNFSINAGYTGTINGLSSSPVIAGDFSMASGTFISTDQTLLMGGNFTRTGGTFTHNSGIVEFSLFGGVTINISGTLTFNELRITSITFPASATLRTMNFGTGVTTNTLNLAGGSRVYAYQGSINIQNGLTIGGTSIASPGATNTATFVITNTVTITGAAAAGRNQLANITFSTTTVPVMTGHISLTGTWNNIQSGNLSAAGTSTVNFFGANGAITTHTAAPATISRRAKFHNLTIQTGATVSMGNRNWIEVSRNLTLNGTFNTTSQSGIHFDGTTATQSVTGSTTSFTIGSVLRSSNNSTVTLAGVDLTVLDSIKFAGPNGKINTNGRVLFLPSTNTLKARISTIGAGTLATNAHIQGNIRVQTFAPGGLTDWTNLGASGVTGLTVGSWDGQIPMTCNGCTNGTTTAGGPFASFVFYNEPGNGGTEYVTANSTDPLTPGRGAWVFLGNGLTSTSDLSWTVNGPAVMGTVNVGCTNTPGSAFPGNNLVANPYACPIKWNNVRAIGSNSTNFGASMHIYNADLGLTSSFNGQTGITTPSGSGANNVIPMGQGFFVEANSNATLVFTERAKCNNNTGANQLLKLEQITASSGDTIEPAPVPDVFDYLSYFRLKLKNTSGIDYDETVMHFHPNSNSGYEDYDTKKLFEVPAYLGYSTPYSQFTSLSTRLGGIDYAINSLATSATTGYTVPLLAKVMTSGTFSISAFDFVNMPAGFCLSLKDNLLNVTHDLMAGAYTFTISDTTSTPRFDLIICPVMNTTAVNELPTESKDFSVFPNPSNGDFNIQTAIPGKYEIINQLGQVVYKCEKQRDNDELIEVVGLRSGIYFLKNDLGKSFKKIVVTK